MSKKIIVFSIFLFFFCSLFYYFSTKHVLALSITDISRTLAECQALEGTCSQYCAGATERSAGKCEGEGVGIFSSGGPCCVTKEKYAQIESTLEEERDRINNSDSFTPADASFTYTPLEEIPGQGAPDDFVGYIQALYLFVLSAVGIAGLLMAIIGGFIYVSSAGNSSQVEKGKEYIKDALIGIVIAFSSWLILNVINPDLVNVPLSLDSLSAPDGSDADLSGEGSDPDTYSSGSLYAGGGAIPPQIGGGTCGGMNNNVGNQCELASSELSSMLKCMKDNGDTGTITSVSARNIGNDFAKAKACCGNSSCTHATNTCHYGCTTNDKGRSYAVDYGISRNASNAQLCAIAERAQNLCGGGTIWGPKNITCSGGAQIRYQRDHDTHLHISTRGCNH